MIPKLIKLNNSNRYSLELNERQIGYAELYLNNEKENLFEIFVEPEYRGNGYGKYLFSEIIKELIKMNYKDTILYVDKKNMQMIKLIADFNGLLLSQDSGKAKYVLPLKIQNENR